MVLFSSRDDDDRLAQINSVFRTIDLASLSLAPLSAGLVFDFVSNSAAAYFIAAWNVVSVVFEYLLLKSIYRVNREFVNDLDDLESTRLPVKK